MKWMLFLLIVVCMSMGGNAQGGIIGLQLNLQGKPELIFDEPNLRGYVQDSVWITENNEMYVTDVVNMLYQFGTLCEKGEDIFVPTSLDPSRKFNQESAETGLISNDQFFLVSDSLLQMAFYSDWGSATDSISYNLPCADWFMGYNISDQVMPIIHQALEDYCKTRRLLDQDELERSAFQELLFNLCAMDENNYVSDSAAFVIDRCQLHICRKGRLEEIYFFAHDFGVTHYTIRYNEVGEIIRFEEYKPGFAQSEFTLSYDEKGRVVLCTNRYRDSRDDASELLVEYYFEYDSSGRMNRYFSESTGEVSMRYCN